LYPAGNVKLRPELLEKHQAYTKEQLKSENDKPVFLVFHGGSGSTKDEITRAVKAGVVKMNIDTDTQWAYMEGFRDYFLGKQDYLKTQVGNPDGEDKPNKKYYVRSLGSLSVWLWCCRRWQRWSADFRNDFRNDDNSHPCVRLS
jgi:fructose-bisphosphate aldolase class II